MNQFKKRGRLWLAKELDDQAPQPSPFEIVGESGLKEFGGYIAEEWHHKLRGQRGVRIYKEMADNDAVVGAYLYAIESLIRGVSWPVEPRDDSPAAAQAAEFVESCRDDMSLSWNDLISEIMTMLVFGWSYFELVYKMRRGPDQTDPKMRSSSNDGKIGWRKISIRAQETLSRWWFQDDGGIVAMEQMLPQGGFARIPIEKALLFRTRSHKNNPEGYSVLRRAFRSWYIKKRLEEIEAIGIERDLAGLPTLQVPPEMLLATADSDTIALRNELLSLVQQVRRDEREGLLVPAEEDANGKTGYKFQLLTSGGTRAIPIGDAIKRYESRMAMSVLAEVIMLGIDGGGNRALGESKIDLFMLALSSFMDSIEAVLNRFAIPRLMQLNGVTSDLWPKFKHGELDQQTAVETADIVTKLVSAGALAVDQPLKDHLREEAGFPSAELTEEDEDKDDLVKPSTALSNDQVGSLVGIIEKVTMKLISRESGINLITAAFPFSKQQAEAMIGTAGTAAFEPQLAETVGREIGAGPVAAPEVSGDA